MTIINWLGVFIIAVPVLFAFVLIAKDIGWRAMLIILVCAWLALAVIRFGAYLAWLPA